MKIIFIYIKRFYEKYRYIVFPFIIVIMLMLCFIMIKKILLDFPNKDGENLTNYYIALSQLFAGILGGIFTIIGVSLTIFIANSDRKKDLISTDKPRLLYGENIENSKKNNILKPKLMTIYETDNKIVYMMNEIFDKTKKYYTFALFDIYITDNADCILEQIIFGDKMIYPLCNEFILKKDHVYTIDLSNYYFVYDNSISSITLVVSSLLERKYYFTIDGDDIIKKSDNGIIYYEITDYFLAERIYGFDKRMDRLERQLDLKSTEYINDKIRNNRK